MMRLDGRSPLLNCPKEHKTPLNDTLLLLLPIISTYYVMNRRVDELIQAFVCPNWTSS